jgi:hypothetical protein
MLRHILGYFFVGVFLLPLSPNAFGDFLFANKLRDFSTDGCTLFPDGEWRICCVKHDLLYWRGGSRAEKTAADHGLKECVAEHGFPETGEAMLLGVLVGGAPEFPTAWRWGYGWVVNRRYNSLDDEQIDQLNSKLSSMPDDPAAFPIEKTNFHPQRETITGDYCLDSAGQKIEDTLKHSFVIQKVFVKAMEQEDLSWKREYTISVKGCLQPFQVDFTMANENSCAPPGTEASVSRDIHMKLKGGPGPNLCSTEPQTR